MRADLEALSAAGSCTVYEACPAHLGMDAGMRPLTAGHRLCGRALTVFCHPGDNLAIHRAIAAAQPHEVIVAAAAGTMLGYWGEVTTVAATARRVAGLIIDGAVRDAQAIRQHNFPVWCRGVDMHGTTKSTPGRLRVPIVCGGVTVADGDLIVADDDGVAVVPSADLEATIQAAEKRVQKEADYMRRLEAGELTLDLLGLRQVLKERGLNG